MSNIILNEPINTKDGKTLILTTITRLGFELFGIIIEDRGGIEVRTFNDETIARLAMHKLINRSE